MREYITKHLSTKCLGEVFSNYILLFHVNIWEVHFFPVYMKVRFLFLQWVAKENCSKDCSSVGNSNSRAVITTLSLGTSSHQHCNHYLEKDKNDRWRQMSIFNFFYKAVFFPVAPSNHEAMTLLWKELANLAVESEAI